MLQPPLPGTEPRSRSGCDCASHSQSPFWDPEKELSGLCLVKAVSEDSLDQVRYSGVEGLKLVLSGREGAQEVDRSSLAPGAGQCQCVGGRQAGSV